MKIKFEESEIKRADNMSTEMRVFAIRGRTNKREPKRYAVTQQIPDMMMMRQGSEKMVKAYKQRMYTDILVQILKDEGIV